MPLKYASHGASIKEREKIASYNIRLLTHEHKGDPKWPRSRIIAASMRAAGISRKR